MQLFERLDSEEWEDVQGPAVRGRDARHDIEIYMAGADHSVRDWWQSHTGNASKTGSMGRACVTGLISGAHPDKPKDDVVK
jgi:hypothetical protein